MPLFTRALTQLGTAKGDFVDLTRRVGMGTGGRRLQRSMPVFKGRPDRDGLGVGSCRHAWFVVIQLFRNLDAINGSVTG